LLQSNRETNYKLSGICLIAAVLLLCQGMVVESGHRSSTLRPHNSSGVTRNLSAVVNQICLQIQKDNFVGARELLAREGGSNDSNIRRLDRLVSEYEAIERERRIERQRIYRQQLDKLHKLCSRQQASDDDNVGDALEAIATAAGVADQEQKKALLQERFVESVIRKAIIKAAQCEAEGRWLDAYTQYYAKLQALDPDNRAYTDHSQQLVDKADIATSLRDSPCETVAQRYAGISRESLITAIRRLDSDYVVRIDDYRQMARGAVERCRLLVEVAKLQSSGKSTSLKISSQINEINSCFLPFDNKKSDDWSRSLAKILQELRLSARRVDINDFIDIFESVLALNATTAKLPEEMMIFHFGGGAFSALDRYTGIIWPSEVADFKKELNGRFSGIGICFSKEKDLWTVSSLLPDTPAYHSGLDAGDMIEAVDGTSTENMSAGCMVRNITGPAGTDVTLTVRRTITSAARNVTITRAPITLPSVCGWQRTEQGRWRYIIDNDERIGFIRLTSFNDNTIVDFEEVLGRLETEGLEGLILDLRSNPGGVVNAAAGVVDRFVEKGIIVSTRPRYGMSTYLSAHLENTHPDYPVVVLVDKASASAAEIVAGALQDPKYKRGILVGERTLGKGSVQTVVHLPGGAMLKYTMAHYHLPSGRTVESQGLVEVGNTNNWGIIPDIQVELTKDERKTIAQIRRSNAALTRGVPGNGSTAKRKSSSSEAIDADPQLAVGLLVLKSKMLRASHPIAMN